MDIEIYQQQILHHNRNPRNFHVLENPTHQCVGHNPLCGDKLTLQLEMENGDENQVIKQVAFTGDGCAISKASASMMTDALLGKTEKEVKVLFRAFRQLVVGDENIGPNSCEGEQTAELLGKLAVFGSVKNYPSRVKCAILCWYAAVGALDNKKITATDDRSL